MDYLEFFGEQKNSTPERGLDISRDKLSPYLFERDGING